MPHFVSASSFNVIKDSCNGLNCKQCGNVPTEAVNEYQPSNALLSTPWPRSSNTVR